MFLLRYISPLLSLLPLNYLMTVQESLDFSHTTSQRSTNASGFLDNSINLLRRKLKRVVGYYRASENVKGLMDAMIPMTEMYQDLPMYEQSCKLWKRQKVLKQCESNIFKCNTVMLSILFIYIILRS